MAPDEQALETESNNPAPSVRESLESAIKGTSDTPERRASSDAPNPVVDGSSPPSRPEGRDDKGRFAGKDGVKDASLPDRAYEPATGALAPQTAPDKPLEAPSSWSPERKALFSQAPKGLQEYIVQRESESHEGVAKIKGEYEGKARIADSFQQVVTPYLPMIQAEGGHPVAAVQSLLNTAYVLRTGNPQQKTALFRDMAQRFGVDLAQVQAEAPYVDPQVSAVSQELQQVRQAIAQQEQRAAQAQVHERVSAIEQFANAKDAQGQPLRPYYGEVEKTMVTFVAHVRNENPTMPHAEVLEKAYNLATQAHPAVSEKLIAARIKAAEESRRREQEQATATARAAGVSVTGSPGVGRAAAVAAVGKPKSVRASLEDAMQKQGARI